MRLVMVVWDDAHADLDEHGNEEASGLMRTHTPGWLVYEDEEVIRLAWDAWPGHPGRSGGRYAIPKGMIVEVVDIAPVEKSDYIEENTGV